ncbi:hypothetical protein ACIQNG_16260 [Streptomyces sp. NPDC091377]|uniref:hypothetical protein n=1 Tax=unclassified Streptomyces TaxID=2593676 RepID=UPI003822E260
MRSAVGSSQGAGVALRFGRRVAMGTVAVLILIAGVWASWGSAQYVMLTKGRERGTVEVARCGDEGCGGRFVPSSVGGRARESVVLDGSVGVEKGRTYAVVMKPGRDVAVRSGPGGVVYAWVPWGGALLLASVVVAGGLRWTRVAWVMAGSGAVLVTAAFLAV